MICINTCIETREQHMTTPWDEIIDCHCINDSGEVGRMYSCDSFRGTQHEEALSQLWQLQAG